MSRGRLLVGVTLAIVGAVWIGQGLGYLPGSFMTGDPFWAAAGVALAIGALVLLASARRRQEP